MVTPERKQIAAVDNYNCGIFEKTKYTGGNILDGDSYPRFDLGFLAEYALRANYEVENYSGPEIVSKDSSNRTVVIRPMEKDELTMLAIEMSTREA